MTVRAALSEGVATLALAQCPSSRADAEWLLAHVLGSTRTGLHLNEGRLSEDEMGRFRELLGRRAKREPLAYILGEWGFRRLTLAVDPRVLIPRPETEVVVERCLALLEEVGDPLVLDVGVGSGAIALALADERPDAQVIGTETSQDALAVAEENRVRIGLNGRVRFVRGDLLGGEAGPFDLVVSNPPYVSRSELPELEPELRYEPEEALVGDDRHDAVARAALAVLRPGAALVLEAGDGQACRIKALLVELGYLDVLVSPDLTGRERIVEGRRP